MISLHTIIRHGAAAALVALAIIAGGERAAADGPLKLRANISVTSEIVRIGDLFDNAGGAAEIPVFRAPSPGHSGFLTASRITYALRNHGLRWNNPYRIDEVAVHREGRRIPLSEIEDAIGQRISKLDGDSDAEDLEIEFDRGSEPLVVPVDAIGSLQILHADFEPRSGRFVAVVSTSRDAAGESRRKYTGRAVEVATVPVITRTVSRGEHITGADVAMTRVKRSAVPASALFDESDVIGMVSRRTLRSGAVVRAHDVERPQVVRKSDLVTVVYAMPGLLLSTKAVAMESGGKGDVVTIMNPRSKRIIEAVVTGPSAVSALAPRPLRSAALARSASAVASGQGNRYAEE